MSIRNLTIGSISIMKKTLLFALLIALSAIGSTAQAGDILVKGKIEGIKKGRLYLLARSSETATDTLGYCDFKKGKFNLKVNLQEPMVTNLIVEGYSGGFTLIAEPGIAYKARLSNDSDFYIKGGKLNESYAAHMASSDSLRAIVTELQERYKTLREAKKFRSASQVNDTLRIEQNRLQELTGAFLRNNDNVILAYTMLSNIEMREMSLRDRKSVV